ncbi:hypothetical protein QH494_21780 [Sphingomonas sp. AR_OL41]|uniref:hypothetical protein n=1 Tax=Sphingomonas sp. AR_OL41 TaxID=3042729 RepID=UPI00247FD415|nr:hypothetical protein [Sphingomonas sp. AR_OL41]MDH7974827.1 hypothetical protein [Sphingomonas sp. AR_OL41]
MKQMWFAILLVLGIAPGAPALAQLTGTVMAPETKEQFILRSRYHIPGRTAATVVYLHSLALRDIREEYSSIATRNDDGSWTVGTMGEIGPAAKAIKLRVVPEKLRRLSKADGAALDALLADEALYLTASTLPVEPDNSATYRTMEIVTPGHRVVVRWIGALEGKAGRVADLVAAGGAGAKGRTRR